VEGRPALLRAAQLVFVLGVRAAQRLEVRLLPALEPREVLVEQALGVAAGGGARG
jgi:hypothetical protein